MYVTHGDTIIFRTGRQGRHGTSTRLRPYPDAYTERRDPRHEAWDGLRDRVAELEERLSRLEARLQGAAASRRSDAPGRPRPATGPLSEGADARRDAAGARSEAPGGVKVSVHAGSGAQVSLGEVRMIQHS